MNPVSLFSMIPWQDSKRVLLWYYVKLKIDDCIL